eukprot:6196762-Pleurochrysis_carterae.AAC.1
MDRLIYIYARGICKYLKGKILTYIPPVQGQAGTWAGTLCLRAHDVADRQPALRLSGGRCGAHAYGAFRGATSGRASQRQRAGTGDLGPARSGRLRHAGLCWLEAPCWTSAVQTQGRYGTVYRGQGGGDVQTGRWWSGRRTLYISVGRLRA